MSEMASASDTRVNSQVHLRTMNVSVNLPEELQTTKNGPVITTIPIDGPDELEAPTLVSFTPNDPRNPQNWSSAFKWYCTIVVAFASFVVTFNSSVVTADLPGVSKEFGVSEQVSLLTVSLLVLGFGIGPMIFSPFSEVFGRRVVYSSTLAVATILVIPAALAPNIQILLIARALDGVAFSAPMTVIGGTLADLWRPQQRGVAMAAFNVAPFLGPVAGPLVGGYLSMGHGWRWLYWIQLILAGIAWILITFTVPETYAPTILAQRAAKLRHEDPESAYTIENDTTGTSYVQRMRLFLVRPFQLLFREPIVLCLSMYMSVLYGIMYMFFIAYPYVYQYGKGYDAGTTGLMFIPMGVGVLLGVACSPFVNKHYLTLWEKHNGKPPAEARLIPMMLSCWFVPMGVFFFAWTSFPRLSWAGPAMGGLPVSFGFIFLYNSGNSYMVDGYQHQAASAIAAKTFLRSIWGALTVHFTPWLYVRLGLQWATTLLACVSLACCAIPFIFYFYGARIRRHSKYTYKGDDEKTVVVKMSAETFSTLQSAA